HRAGIACRQAISQQTLFQSVSRALLFNDDYFLIWTGTTETENGTITPTTVVGSASMTEDQCEKCLAVLLEATEEKTPKNNPAMQAESTGKPIILTDLLNDTPQVMLQKTMLEGGYAACVALPLLWRKKVYGVLNLYTLNRETFDDKEIELLAGLAGSMGLALHVFEEEQQLTHEQERTKSLLAALDSPLLTFSTKGEILSCNEMFANLLKISAEQIVNRNWLTILQPVSGALPHEENKDDLLKNLAAKNEEVELKILGNNENRHLYAKISAIYNPDGSIQEFACLGKEFAINTHTDSEINQQCQTVISELSAGVAHEISDLSNGIINYAQVLTDNDPYQQESVEDIEILGKIISSGERIAEVVHKLIFYGQKEHAGGEYLPLTTVLDDAVLLIKHHLKSEGIQLELELNSKSLPIPVHAQIMQQVLINIFNHRRHALNRRYSGHAANKQLTVASDISTEAGKRFFHISFTDQCEDLTAGDIKLFATNDTQAKPTRTLKELLRCRELIQGQGGNMVLENNSDHETISIQIIFPLKG
ncbi:MAG: GAF domain-containing protein, partial [Desulfobulbaceae bacterium]|nr:GAF domain-containing protein [Desulfobulbaceae bacterium]